MTMVRCLRLGRSFRIQRGSFRSIAFLSMPTTDIRTRRTNDDSPLKINIKMGNKYPCRVSSNFPILQSKRNIFGLFSKNGLTEALVTDHASVMKQYINFTDIKPDHVREAAEQSKMNYETEIEALESSMKSNAPITYNQIMPELERISRPLTVQQNIITLLSCVLNDARMSDALQEANDQIKRTSLLSKRIENVLVQVYEELDESKVNEEKKRAISGLLQKQRLNGSLSNDDELQQQVSQYQQMLEQTQAKFLQLSSLTLEQNGKSATPQELIPLMYEIIALQQHFSKLLGYQTYAEYSLANHNAMANSVEEIESVHKLFEHQGAVKKFSSDEFQSTYLDLVGSSVDMKDYLELNNVLLGMFSLCKTLFGVRIEEAAEESNGWHPDVRLYHLYEDEDTSNKPKASFYFDPYRRQHKDRGCFVVPIQYANNECIPILALSMDIKPPMWDDSPIELEVQDVVNLYHEFGHALQHMLTNVKLGVYSGCQRMEEDASEAISQFMEYWLFEGGHLSNLCKHKHTGESVSEEVLLKIKNLRKATKANELLQRLFLGSLELDLSSKFDPRGDESLIALQRRNAERYTPHFVPPQSNIDPLIQIFQSNAFGKRTMQYRYLWSEIISADAFAAFTHDDGSLKSEEEMKEIGKRMRHEFFGPGASKSVSDSFESFRGRNANIVALLESYGLLK